MTDAWAEYVSSLTDEERLDLLRRQEAAAMVRCRCGHEQFKHPSGILLPGIPTACKVPGCGCPGYYEPLAS